jgi:hypothetical protein
MLGMRLLDALALVAEDVGEPSGVEPALPLGTAEGPEHEGSEQHQKPARGRSIEPGSAADLCLDGGPASAEDVTENAGALLAELGASQDPGEVVQDAAVVVPGEGAQELLGAGGPGGVLGESPQESGEGGRDGLPGGARINAELLAELRDRAVVELVVDEVDQGSQSVPPSGREAWRDPRRRFLNEMPFCLSGKGISNGSATTAQSGRM